MTAQATSLQSGAPPQATLTGSLLIVIGATRATAFTGITDSAGNTYTLATAGGGSTGHGEIWYAANAASIGAAGWVKATAAGSSTIVFHVLEVTGAATSGVLDQVANTNGSTTAPSATTPALTNAVEFAVAGITIPSNTKTMSGFTSGWTLLAEDFSNVTNLGVKLDVGWQITAATTALTYAATLSASAAWDDAIATFNHA